MFYWWMQGTSPVTSEPPQICSSELLRFTDGHHIHPGLKLTQSKGLLHAHNLLFADFIGRYRAL